MVYFYIFAVDDTRDANLQEGMESYLDFRGEQRDRHGSQRLEDDRRAMLRA
jgi:hypothetical protein